MKDDVLELQASAPAFTHVGEVLEQHADIALNFVQQHEDTCYARQEEKAVLRKIALTLMPLVRSLSHRPSHSRH